MNKNTFSWTQELWGIKKMSPKERRDWCQTMLRAINLDVGEGYIRFKVISVDPIHRRTERPFDNPYRIKLIASTSAIKRMTAHWGSGQYFTLNGKRKRTP